MSLHNLSLTTKPGVAGFVFVKMPFDTRFQNRQRKEDVAVRGAQRSYLCPQILVAPPVGHPDTCGLVNHP